MFVLESHILAAGPCTGKSSLIRILAAYGYEILDTDDLVNKYVPKYFETRAWTREKEFSPDAKTCVEGMRTLLGVLCRVALTSAVADRLLVVTNLWGREVRYALGEEFLKGSKWPVYFTRESPDEVHNLSEGRSPGHGIPVGLAQAWQKSVEKFKAEAFNRVIALKPGEFLGNVLELGFGPLKGEVPGRVAKVPISPDFLVSTNKIQALGGIDGTKAVRDVKP